MQGELCNSLALLPNTPKPREDKPSRRVKLLLCLLGSFKKSHFVVLKSPDSQVTARGENVRQKVLPGVSGQSWGHRKHNGSTHMGSSQAPLLFPLLLWARPQI